MSPGDPRDVLHDHELALEIRLLTEVIIAASSSQGRLQEAQMDELLDVPATHLCDQTSQHEKAELSSSPHGRRPSGQVQGIQRGPKIVRPPDSPQDPSR